MLLFPHPTSEADSPPELEAFITRWSDATGKERANCHLFHSELCIALDLEQPEPGQREAELNAYVFERKVTIENRDDSQSFDFINIYKRGALVLEAKQTRQTIDSGWWDAAILRARC